MGPAPDESLKLVTDDVRYRITPVSMGIPDFDKKGMENLMKTGFQKIDFKILDTLASADGSKVSIECTSEGARADGTHYANEYIFIFHLTDGKISYINEMLDSAYVGVF